MPPRVLVASAQRWAAEGVAEALRRSGASGPLEVAVVAADAAPWPAADVLLVVAPIDAALERAWRALPADLPMVWVGEPWPDDPRVAGRLRASATDAQLALAVASVAAGLDVSDAPHAAAPPRFALDDPLTPRELEVFELMAKGLANADIALALGISRHTAKYHVAQILAKTGAATRTEAVRQGLRLGLVGL